MGVDCFLVWIHDDEIDLEAVFMDADDARYYQAQRTDFMDKHLDDDLKPTFHITHLKEGLYEPNSLP